MKNHFLSIVFFTLMIISCKSSKENKLNDFMVGNWQTEYIKIKMPTVGKSDSLFVFEDHFNKPNSIIAKSTYKKDGTFSAWMNKPDGTRFDETNGIWKAKGDSLYVEYSYKNREIKAWYSIEQKNNAFEGKVIYDWDNDGEFDDTLLMKSKKINFK